MTWTSADGLSTGSRNSLNFNENMKLFFKNIHLKMLSATWQPFCSGINQFKQVVWQHTRWQEAYIKQIPQVTGHYNSVSDQGNSIYINVDGMTRLKTSGQPIWHPEHTALSYLSFTMTTLWTQDMYQHWCGYISYIQSPGPLFCFP